MTGRVQCFIPAVRRGILQTECGDELPFLVPENSTDLQGGDIVEFDMGDAGQPFVRNITLRHRWAELLNEEHRPLVNQFHHTVEICA